MDQDDDIIVIDNLQSGHRSSIEVEHFYQIDF